VNPYEYLSEKLNNMMFDAMEKAQDKQIKAAAAGPAPPPAPLTPEEMAAFARTREWAWRYLILPALAILIVAVASFYSGTIGIPSTLFAIGFVFWAVANRKVVCPRCGASLLGKAEKRPACGRCGVKLRAE